MSKRFSFTLGMFIVVAGLGLSCEQSSSESTTSNSDLKPCRTHPTPPCAEDVPTPHSNDSQGWLTCWYEDDGIDVMTAGCHVSAAFVDTCGGAFVSFNSQGSFGEYCIDDKTIVETGPGAGWHEHHGDVGHPQRMTCPGTTVCRATTASCSDGGSVASAACVEATDTQPAAAQPGAEASAVNPLAAPDSFASQEPYAYQDPYTARDPYAYQDPATQDPYVTPDPNYSPNPDYAYETY